MTNPASDLTLSLAPSEGERETKGGDISIEELSHTFESRDLRVIDNLSIHIEPGSFVSFIGPSGCGKSTLLDIIGGLLRPTEGVVKRNGELVTGPSEDMGMMFQTPALLPWRSAVDNVLLPLEIRGGKELAAEYRPFAMQLLEMTDLIEFAHVYPYELSGGMAQRVAICRMLVTSPQVLLLDEPFGALDELTRDRMDLELQRICSNQDATAVLITHAIAEAALLSDQVYVLGPRPTIVMECIDIPFSRPRTMETSTSPEFSEMVRRIRRILDEGEALARRSPEKSY